ncbi:hypothetical protein F4809DRAFT_615606 [Biscogniauxia mediterranea]|nr:hypothetical protein F4809DRAFT_615606 [Biscogniauxia mediterranea]
MTSPGNSGVSLFFFFSFSFSSFNSFSWRRLSSCLFQLTRWLISLGSVSGVCVWLTGLMPVHVRIDFVI